MKVEVIQDVSRFRDMHVEWNALLEKSNTLSIYLSWEWLFTWWEIFGKPGNRQLSIITARDNGELVGIAPFIKRQIKAFGMINRIRLEFLGTGEDEKDEVCSNYMDFIVSKDREDVCGVIFDYLANKLSSGEWDELVFRTMPETSATFDTISEYFSRNKEITVQLKYEIVNHSECAVINLPENWENYLSSLDTNWRHQIRSGRKQLERQGRVETVYITDCQFSSSALNDFIKLHQKRWKNTNGTTLFSSEKFTNFHRRILDLFLKKQCAGFSFLKVNGETVAACYRYFYAGTVYAYLSAYNTDFKNRVGVGILERGYDIESAINNKYTRYDLYKAKKGSYKWHLAKDKRVVCDIHIFRKGIEYCLLTGIKKCKNFAKVVKTSCLGIRKV